ncbi:hypothetical protein [Halarcobacter ebronensis]|uniref:hypothetical protein n=1 Tax=Halarcobacter ebronensis TaxID=1462615 RepID=UPI001009FE53|nr:hypothetical protein [Halarcobacter ebronensis]
MIPKDYEYINKYIAIPAGYLIYSWLAYIVSGNFDVNGATATYISLLVFFIMFIYVNIRYYKSNNAIYNHFNNLKTILFTSSIITIVILWPMFYYGSETFLSVVNPDLLAGLVDNNYLLDFSNISKPLGFNAYSFVNSMSGSIPPSARFSSTYFALLLNVLLPINTQESLTLAVALFVFALPLSVYSLARVVFNFDHKVSLLAAFLIGISGPTTLSYIYNYLGQNSGIGAMPATMVIIYIFLKNRNLKTFLFASFAINGFYLMYTAMLAYVLAPIGLLLIYLIIKKEIKLFEFLIYLLMLFVVTFIFNYNMVIYLYNSLIGWSNLVAQSLQGQYFLDFLTEEFFGLFFGVVSYNSKASFFSYLPWNLAVLILYFLTIVYAFYLIYFIYRFSFQKDNIESKIFGLGGFIIYAIVWYIYTFDRNYGYAVFKMASWIQFILVIFMAYGFNDLYNNYKNSTTNFYKKFKFLLLSLIVIIAIGGNFLSSMRLTTYAMGHNNVRGSIVNLYNVSGNKDYINLEKDLMKIVSKNESIGLININSIQNELVAFYLRNYKTSIMSHLQLPGDDENLPDIKTNLVVDYYGNIKLAENPFLHENDDYYLISIDKFNNDIVINGNNKNNIYENKTFKLFKNNDIKDLLFTGRGFYRLEHSNKNKDFWWPRDYRWTSEGGEIFILNPDNDKNYNLNFFAYVGYGKEIANRAIEIWVNGTKIDEQKVDYSAKVRTKNFKLNKRLNKIVIKISENVDSLKRPLPLWNKNIPYDYRKLNLLLSDVSIKEIIPIDNKEEYNINYYNFFEIASTLNGIEPNGWASDSISAEFNFNHKVEEMTFNVLFPQIKEVKLPTYLKITVNNEINNIKIDKYGKQDIKIKLKEPTKRINFIINSNQTFNPSHSREDRCINYSYQLMNLSFATGKNNGKI